MLASMHCYLRCRCSYQGAPDDVAVDVMIQQSTMPTCLISSICIHNTTDRMHDSQAAETVSRGPSIIDSPSCDRLACVHCSLQLQLLAKE